MNESLRRSPTKHIAHCRNVCRLIAVVGLVLHLLLAGPATGDEPQTIDLLLRGGTAFDGTGNEGKRADVAVAGGRIVAVGKLDDAQARRVVDCKGLFVAPGFIDLHTHCDRAIDKPPTRANLNYVTQGCTTVVTGNCGLGRADVDAFLDTVDRHGAGTNVIHLAPHGSIRLSVMGDANREPTSDELARMKHSLDSAMRAGAWGISSGLIYVPGIFAETDEIVEMAKVAAAHGGIYATHMRNEGGALLDGVREAIEIGRQAGIPVHVSHFKVRGVPNWGNVRKAAQLIAETREAGLAVTADQYPYTATSTSLAATLLRA